jgi:hypothetical protein
MSASILHPQGCAAKPRAENLDFAAPHNYLRVARREAVLSAASL